MRGLTLFHFIVVFGMLGNGSSLHICQNGTRRPKLAQSVIELCVVNLFKQFQIVITEISAFIGVGEMLAIASCRLI